MREHQGKYPVLFLSFSGAKEPGFPAMKKMINVLIANLYSQFAPIINEQAFSDEDRKKFASVNGEMDTVDAAISINTLCGWLQAI